ncbi:capsular polysaccharide export protein, LipB/KpsS family [Pseudomonas sp. CNPSo 3701]|uniref:capsular polysaccharide export protein, LipB/KpsS family n=1 Tax=Pseudomonas sp. CNPSo 3701 TaxID=3027943 RepID=UPI0023644A85|nr:capsular biosynthesis protein [Pseudomonas sp. CNPSo 3701]MDD1510121.1 capsular biosynthesis protein [Pseudomonas sp. CNPSo 3701]
MTQFLFLALAKHQLIYFKRLLDETELQGKVFQPSQLPLPRPWRLSAIAGRLDWAGLIEEKCQERRVKRKYEGFFYRLLLRLELAWMALRVEALLHREKPENVAVWNGSHRYCQLLLALRPEGCGTFFFENGLLPDTTTLDSKGVNYRNSVPRNAEFYRRYIAPEGAVEARLQLIPRPSRNKGLEPIRLPHRYVFMPFQDDRDTQVRLFSPWVGDMRQLFALGKRLADECGLTVVFKEHPSSRETYPDLHAQVHERLLFANGNPTQELIQNCEFVVTLNSTVGLESLLLGKPVMTLGQAFFNIPGIVAHADSASELLELAANFPRWGLDDQLRQSFLRYLAAEYCIQGGWREADGAQLQRVANRMLDNRV